MRPWRKKAHHRAVSDLEQKSEPSAPTPGASISEVMHYRLKTAAGRANRLLVRLAGLPDESGVPIGMAARLGCSIYVTL